VLVLAPIPYEYGAVTAWLGDAVSLLCHFPHLSQKRHEP
jgi:hypothetical protein